METSIVYSVNYFIKKFEAIPERLWCSLMVEYGESKCALGHCGLDLKGENPTEESDSLGKLLLSFYEKNMPSEGLPNYVWHRSVVTGINDGRDGYLFLFPQPTPKQRILAALYDIKKMQEKVIDLAAKPTYENISKELAVLPINETSDQPIKELKKVFHK